MKSPNHVPGKPMTISPGFAKTGIAKLTVGPGGKEAIEETKRRSEVRAKIEDYKYQMRDRDPWEYGK